jgi:hypothetical protein
VCMHHLLPNVQQPWYRQASAHMQTGGVVWVTEWLQQQQWMTNMHMRRMHGKPRGEVAGEHARWRWSC